MDIEYIITAVVSSVTAAGGMQAFRYVKENKQKMKSEVIKEDATAGSEMLGLLRETSGFFKELVTGLKESIKEKDETIKLFEERFKGYEESQSKQEKRIKNLTVVVKKVLLNKDYAEGHLCKVRDCALREPALGTYKTENPIIEGE